MYREEWLEDLQFNLKALISESGMSVREISKKSGVSIASISRYSNGRQVPTLEAAINLAYALNCDLEDFVNIYEKIE